MKLLNRLKINTSVLFKYFISIGGSLTAFATLILSFASWEDLGIETVSCKLLILIGLGVVSFLIATVTILVRNKKTIFGEIDKGLSIQYGDVIDLGFNNHGKSKKIIVIPFNRCFDLSCENNLISKESIHGQWLDNYISSEKDRKELHQRIETYDFIKYDNDGFAFLNYLNNCHFVGRMLMKGFEIIKNEAGSSPNDKVRQKLIWHKNFVNNELDIKNEKGERKYRLHYEK